jgi:hypothetical protein
LTLTAELDAVRDEIGARDNAIAKLQTGLDNKDVVIANLESQLSGAVAENKDQVLTIAELENKLIGAVAELKDRDIAITKLESEQSAGNVGQLNLFPPEPEPEPITAVPVFETEPENIKSPAVNSEPLIVTPTEVQAIPLILLDTIEGTVPRKVIMDRILEIDPATEINGQIITDAVLGHNQRLSELETTYKFKFVGYVMKGKNREYRYKLS